MYIVIELQTNTDGQVGNLVTAYEDRNQAESKFHQIMAAAAISELPVHSAIMVDEKGMVCKQDHYDRRLDPTMSYYE